MADYRCPYGYGWCEVPYKDCQHWQGTFCELDVEAEKMDDCKGVREMKYCPFMVSTATTLSLTTAGESYTNAFMEQCIGGRCVAFRPSGDGKGFCARLDNEATYEVTADG